jgi:hypothetical protein
MESDMLKNAIESARFNLIHVKAKPLSVLSRKGGLARPLFLLAPTAMAVFHHVRLHVRGIYVT